MHVLLLADGDAPDRSVLDAVWPGWDDDVARVRLTPGSGQWKINGRSLEDYFPNKLHQQTVNEPFETAAVAGSYDVVAKIVGGGVTGQAGALRLGIARALNAVDAEASRPAE